MVTKVGGIVIDIDARLAKLEASLAKGRSEFRRFERETKQTGNQIEKHVAGMSNSFNQMRNAAITGAFIAAGKRALDYASSLGEVSQQLGVTTKDLQVYRYAATQVGISQDTMDKSLGKLNQSIGKAALGSPSLIKAFDSIGVSFENADGSARTVGEVLPDIADKLSQIEDPAKRAAIEMTLFGKSGQQLDTLLSGGSAAIDELTKSAEAFGLVLTDEQIRKADEFADKLATLKQILEAKLAGTLADDIDAVMMLGNAFAYAAGKAANFFASLSGAEAGSWSLQSIIDKSAAQIDKETGWLAKQGMLGAWLTGNDPMSDPKSRTGTNLSGMVRDRKRSNFTRDMFSGDLLAGTSYAKPKSSAAGFDIEDFLAGGGKKGGKTKPEKDPIQEMLDSVDIEIRNMRFNNSDKLYEDLGIDADKFLEDEIKRIDTRREADLDARLEAMEEARKQEKQNIEDLSDEFYGLFTGRGEAIWKRFADLGFRALADLAAQFLVTGKIGGGGGGGLFGSIFDTVSKGIGLFGGGGGLGLSSSITNSKNLFDTIGFVGLPGHAYGGRPKGPSIVGEKGPELWVPDSSGSIMPSHVLNNHNAMVAAGGGGGKTFYLSGNLLTPEFWAKIQAMDDVAALRGASGGAALARQNSARRGRRQLA